MTEHESGLLMTKRRRIPDTETRERMLGTASRLIGETGLTVSVEHLSYEAVIQEARVARSAAYRLWPSKESFFEDLLCELAGAQWQGTAAFDQETLDTAIDVFVDHLDDLDTPEGRKLAWTEAARLGAQRNFESLVEHAHWRTYVALTATVMSLQPSTLRSRLEHALRTAEAQALAFMGDFYRDMAALVGYRLRPELNGDYSMLAAVGAAVVEGLSLRRIIAPAAVDQTFRLAAFHSDKEEDWTVASLGFTAILFTMIEPDPEFDESRLPGMKEQLLAAKREIQERRSLAEQVGGDAPNPATLKVLGQVSNP